MSSDTPPRLGLAQMAQHRNFLLLAGAVFCVGGAFGVQIPLFANFIFERFGVRTHEYGYLEALRETPGFLVVAMSALVMVVAAPRLSMVCLLVMGAGLAAYAWITDIATLLGGSAIMALIVTSVFWSIGFHVWAPLQNTLALRYAPSDETGRWLGWLRTTSGVGHMTMMGIALLLIRVVEYEGMFIFAGALLVVGAILVGLAGKGDRTVVEQPRERRILFRKRYNVYYLLIFLQGARKQIFLMFAVWLLVKGHGAVRETILILMLINQVLNLLIAPTMGKVVDRYGERLTLSVSFAMLALVFLGYAFVPQTNALYVLYVVDHLLFVGGIAMTTYLNKIAPREDIRPTLTMGVTLNHIPSVLVPLIGGLMWIKLGHTVVFVGGAAFATMSLIVAQWVRPDAPIAAPLQAEPEPAD
ncbi:MFS transporter [Candidatus Poribacteria bacterium]|nr:MFS transporter [Candidatus Poribacteria bacterium]MBT5537262.1 MFS transporter [Candidatus Poribacteria bacterium]MBT7807501.1 MFS transporter [Candidatus Poribacteria bacterium]